MEVSNGEVKTYAMDHNCLVASVCKDMGIAAKIDARMGGKKDPRRRVGTGIAAMAMIRNGLRFTNRRL